MALQVAGGTGCVLLLPPLHRRRALRSPRAVASDAAPAAAREEDGKVALGGSGVAVTKLGIGAWSWGDTTYWNEFQWDDRKLKAAKGAFDASIDCGITFFDTAEVYGAGISGAINSESLLGRFIKERQRKEQIEVAIATKFAALPWRPGIWGNEGYLDGLGDAVEQGLVKAVGVSNYSEKRLRDAYARLKKRGIPLASNQVNYSLIYRNPEENGVKAACDELGITLIAYSPIAQGALTGKYTPDNPPKGPRGRIYTPEFLTKLQPLINRIKEIGGNYGRTPTQGRGEEPCSAARRASMPLPEPADARMAPAAAARPAAGSQAPTEPAIGEGKDLLHVRFSREICRSRERASEQKSRCHQRARPRVDDHRVWTGPTGPLTLPIPGDSSADDGRLQGRRRRVGAAADPAGVQPAAGGGEASSKV
ncbi:putative oxidoreductase [Panicum miliaceum]|uniref:Oxidoreductase n=1 Tax=Panicum miliaceum TaxID=4540 RepID=A0A3L6T9R7_PANMI|nr:putative oxidoreductase [Panicum miliaceum]